MSRKQMTDSKGRPVCDVEFECDGDGSAFIVAAAYADTAPGLYEEVPLEELEYLTDTYPEECDWYAFEEAVSAAEAYYEGDR